MPALVDVMITASIGADSASWRSGPSSPARDSRFAAALAQATPLFSPWPYADAGARSNFSPANTPPLNTHATASNRREGRHARG